MPSWIRELDGVQWYDEAYSVSVSGKTAKQLAQMVKAKKIGFKRLGRPLVLWYRGTDIDALRAQSLAKKAEGAPKKPRKKTPEQEERSWAHMSKKLRWSSNRGNSEGMARHYEKVVIAVIDASNAARAKKKDEGDA